MNKICYKYIIDGIKKKKNGYYSLDGYPDTANFYFSNNSLGDYVLKRFPGGMIARNFSKELEDRLNKIFYNLSLQYGKLGYVHYNRLTRGKTPYEKIEFVTNRPYELGKHSIFNRYGIVYQDNNEFVELDLETRDKYNLYKIIENGRKAYDEMQKQIKSL